MFVGVLWSGAFTAWLGHLTRWKIDPFVWTDCKLGYFVYCFGAHYSSMLVTVMSIEKFFALYFPLKAKSYCTVGAAKWVTSILALVIAGLNFPLLIVVKLNGIICIMANLRGILKIMDTMLYSVIPIFLMLLANAAIIYKLMYIKYKGISHTNESVSKSSTRGSVMVVTISLAFIILTSPRAVDSALEQYISSYPYGSLFIITMVYINHSINGILYCIFGEKFRNKFLKIMPCCRKERVRSRSISTSMSSVLAVTVSVNPVK